MVLTLPKCYYTHKFVWLFILLMVPALEGYAGSCPSLCTCKWKNGKQTVECMERGLITIPEGADPETQVLDLSGNNLQILPRETFYRSGLVNLQRVYLRSCRIGEIHDLAFKGLTNLIELDLSQNLLTAVPSGTFRHIRYLRDLVLSNNPIQKISSDAFEELHGLVRLDLSNCEIQMVAPKAFEPLNYTLESLKLNGNRLSELRFLSTQTLSRLHGVELHENPWHCDCRLRALKEWLVYNNIPHPVDLVCSGGPERLISKAFSDLHPDDFACKPEILPTSRYVEAIAGENATVSCKANAIPPAHMKWYWNGRMLINNSAFSPNQKIYVYESGKQEKKSILVLTNVQETDSTEFYCVAENKAGNSEANFTLRVSPRPMGITSLGNGQIASLSAALVALIIAILVIISVLLVRLRRAPYVETKTPGQMEIVTVVNGNAVANGKASLPSSTTVSHETPSFSERKHPADLKFCNPVQKPPRVNDIPYPNNYYNGNGSVMSGSYISPSSNSGINPDLINDTKALGSDEIIPMAVENEESHATDRPASGEYSRNVDSLYPSGLWASDSEPYMKHLPNNSSNNSGFVYDDKTPIIGDGASVGGSAEELNFRLSQGTNRVVGYPQDYGLPIVDHLKSETAVSTSAATQVSLPTNAKTLRVWQKGAVPVLPPVTALKRVLTNNRNSPDEGYQEGCGTDV